MTAATRDMNITTTPIKNATDASENNCVLLRTIRLLMMICRPGAVVR
jgi:hypothetical protein